MPALRELRQPNRSLRILRPLRQAASPGGLIIGQRPDAPDAEIERAAEAFAAIIAPFFDELRRVLLAERFDAINSVRASRVRRAVAEAERRYARRFGDQIRTREAERFVTEVEARTAAQIDRSIRSTGTAPGEVTVSDARAGAVEAAARSLADLQRDVSRQAALLVSLERALATEGAEPDRDAVARILEERGAAARGRARNAANIVLRRFAGDVVQQRLRAAGLEEYVWGPTTSADPRELHERYRGQRFRIDSPPLGGHPGEQWGCKCQMIPVRAR
jgi:hypothetical protein